DLLVIRLEDPRPSLVNHADDAVPLSRRAGEARFERPDLIEDRLDGEIARPVDEPDLAVDDHLRHAVRQGSGLLKFWLDEPTPIGASQPPQLVPLPPADRRVVLIKHGRL